MLEVTADVCGTKCCCLTPTLSKALRALKGENVL